jgi:hypothetical protein
VIHVRVKAAPSTECGDILTGDKKKMTIKTWGLLFVAFTGLLFAQTANQNNKTMKMVASGKDAVLDYLANDARQQTHGKNGAYALYTDDAGNSLLVIDGHIFRGRQGAGSFPESLDDVRGVPLNVNFLFGGHIVTEIETIENK